MSNAAANPAAITPTVPCMVTQASPSLSTGNGNDSSCTLLPESLSARRWLQSRRTSLAKAQMKTLVQKVSAVLYPAVCSVTASGAYPAPGGNSLFCFGFAAHRVTVSLQILFGKYTEKISPDPP